MSTKYRKHQILPAQEAQWKLEYLERKFNAGENITRYRKPDSIAEVVKDLFTSSGEEEVIENWIKNHINLDLITKMDQAIRKRRKRYFDNENIATSKKLVELEYASWEVLSKFAKEFNLSLSDSIVKMRQLIEPKALDAYRAERILEESLKEEARALNESIILDFSEDDLPDFSEYDDY